MRDETLKRMQPWGKIDEGYLLLAREGRLIHPLRRTARYVAKSVTIMCALVLVACGEPAPSPQFDASLYVFGTKVDITTFGAEADKAQSAVAELERQFQRMHKDWHAWKPGELTQLNAAIAAGQRFTVSPFLLPLIEQAKQLESLSDGLFSPAIGAIIGAWGFHADERPKGLRPDFDTIRALAAAHPTMADVRIDGDQVLSGNLVVQMDFGGFAKGVALDRAEAVLRSFGIENALINAGGDINTLGQGGDRPWKVGIRDPKSWGVIATLELQPGEDIYTSGNYERFREIDGVRYAHIIDPRTGWPVEHIVSSTVITTNGALADAAATALSVAGPDDWHRIAKRMGVKFAVLVDDRGQVYLNPAMRARIEFSPDQDFTIVESPQL